MALLVGEVEYPRQMMEIVMRMVPAHGLEEKGRGTGHRVAGLEEAEAKEMC